MAFGQKKCARMNAALICWLAVSTRSCKSSFASDASTIVEIWSSSRGVNALSNTEVKHALLFEEAPSRSNPLAILLVMLVLKISELCLSGTIVEQLDAMKLKQSAIMDADRNRSHITCF